MLTGLGIPHGTDVDILIRTYAISVHGIREDAIRETCGRYIRGDVEGHKRGRSPTTDLFSAECRSWANVLKANENRKVKRLEKPEETYEHSYEHRMKMIALFGKLKRALAGDRQAQKELEPYGWKL